MPTAVLAPFDGDALHVVAADDEAERALLHEILSLKAMRALLLEGTEGEPFADPRRRPQLEYVNQIACCLYGAGYADDMNQAKAIVAVQTGSRAAV